MANTGPYGWSHEWMASTDPYGRRHGWRGNTDPYRRKHGWSRANTAPYRRKHGRLASAEATPIGTDSITSNQCGHKIWGYDKEPYSCCGEFRPIIATPWNRDNSIRNPYRYVQCFNGRFMGCGSKERHIEPGRNSVKRYCWVQCHRHSRYWSYVKVAGKKVDCSWSDYDACQSALSHRFRLNRDYEVDVCKGLCSNPNCDNGFPGQHKCENQKYYGCEGNWCWRQCEKGSNSRCFPKNDKNQFLDCDSSKADGGVYDCWKQGVAYEKSKGERFLHTEEKWDNATHGYSVVTRHAPHCSACTHVCFNGRK